MRCSLTLSLHNNYVVHTSRKAQHSCDTIRCETELENEDYKEYAQEVGIATAGFGIGLSVLFGFVAFVAMLGMCCRCKRLHRADLAIAQAEGDNDGTTTAYKLFTICMYVVEGKRSGSTYIPHDVLGTSAGATRRLTGSFKHKVIHTYIHTRLKP